MEQEKTSGMLIRYFMQYRLSGLMLLLFSGIFAIVLSLYHLETEAVLYAFALCALLAAPVLSLHFFFFIKKHRECEKILYNLPLLADSLPKPKTPAEYDLQKIIQKLSRILNEKQTILQNERQEAMDYYTAWTHQIKTPISVMKMTLDGEDTEEHKELLAELFRIEQYVEMALSYLRLESESSDYVFGEYDLDIILRQAVRKYAPQFIRRKIRLRYEPTHATVLTDEKWLLFIIEQVLSNSIKYTREGSVTITVTPEKVLRISDTGIGIAPEDLPRIFEKGYTGYNGRLDKKSTGLGLYLCRTAANRLSHSINAASKPGEGTTISIDLHTKTAPAD